MSSSTILRQPLAARNSALRTARRSVHGVRFASTNPNPSVEAAQKKAQEALASASQTAGKVWEGAKKFMGPTGQRLGKMLGSYREPLLYDLAVAREVVKKVYVTEGLQPPNLATVRTAYETLWARAKDPAYWRSAVQSGEIARIGIYGLEAYGIYKIGEIIGRRSLIGYNIH